MRAGSWFLSHGWLKFGLIISFIAFVNTSFSSHPYIQTMSILNEKLADAESCQDSCSFTLVESIPDNLTFSDENPALMSTYMAHKRLLEKAKEKIHLASFYWSLTDADEPSPDNTSYQGDDIFQSMLKIVKDKKIDVKIAQNITNNDTDILAGFGAQVRTLEFRKLVNAGVMHTKMWVVDETHIYIGSGNFDWRSYTQTKELGVLIENCPCLGKDAEKLFEVYWYLGAPNATLPDRWPEGYGTDINKTTPILVNYNDTTGYVYMSSSPPPFCASGRTQDLDSILNVIRSAKHFIYISVMDYFPLFIYTYPKRFWPVIDNELRLAAIDRRIRVKLLASSWNHTDPSMKFYLKSLYDLNKTPMTRSGRLLVDIQVKLFTVPSSPVQQKIPYARVAHSKFMVTDQHAYIGTSNWAADYFKSTGGVAFILEQPDDGRNGTSLRKQLVDVFLRDWDSKYADYV